MALSDALKDKVKFNIFAEQACVKSMSGKREEVFKGK